MASPDEMGTGEVAALFGVYRSTVQRWVAKGWIPYRRNGGFGQYRYPRAAILALAERINNGENPFVDDTLVPRAAKLRSQPRVEPPQSGEET